MSLGISHFHGAFSHLVRIVNMPSALFLRRLCQQTAGRHSASSVLQLMSVGIGRMRSTCYTLYAS